ncbi:MAG: 4Fe-4S binding protein [Phycisphaerae bacterium]|nr:4Fe-4S binding protein [Phycisphaerae bacterium]
MDSVQKPGQIVFTNKARCRDCYRCVRVCPVKAICMRDGQAYVNEDRCIACGTCIRECPQHAKSYRNDVEHAIRLIRGGGRVAASVAPSFASIYSDWERKALPSALRKLGFSHVAETAVGAYYVAKRTAEVVAAQPGRSHICSACPAVVNYIERYQRDKLDALVPVVSPMLAHARHIKDRLGAETEVIFIGPCVAKKSEAQRPEHKGLVSCVLTFEELAEWLERERIDLAACEESRFDEEPKGHARFFPVEGGTLRTASMTTDLLATEIMCVSGPEEVREALGIIGHDDRPTVIEPLFCRAGCINGPAVPGERNVFSRRTDVLAYATEEVGADDTGDEVPRLATQFRSNPVDDETGVTEERIRAALRTTGKVKAEDELNCGACGYGSCRDKAIAVIKGLAEPEMCIPYMRRLAEQRTDRIIETSPNGIVILDERLDILSMNPTFKRFFQCTEAVCGQKVSYLMDPEPFEQLASGGKDLVEIVARHEKYALICHEILYALREEHQYVGIFVNITKSQASQQELEQLRAETIMQAQELNEHQISMAQKIATFLGEYTAQGEKLAENLMRLAGDSEKKPEGKGPRWPWDTPTSR